jgi:hypothetical protein
MNVVVSRDELRAELRRWREGRVNASGLKAWLEGAQPGRDPTVKEVLADLDVLEVHLLTPDDVPALLRFLDEEDHQEGLRAWVSYRDGIDLDARSRALKRDRFYRPFCR